LELNESLFSSEGLTVTLERTVDGKAKATVPTVVLRGRAAADLL